MVAEIAPPFPVALLSFNAELTTVTVPPALIAPPSVGAPPLGVFATFPTNVELSTRKDRLVAHVKSAVELSDAQLNKLNAALSKQMGRDVHINLEIDPKVLGGISIRYADDVIDGTIVNRLAEAGRALVS